MSELCLNCFCPNCALSNFMPQLCPNCAPTVPQLCPRVFNFVLQLCLARLPICLKILLLVEQARARYILVTKTFDTYYELYGVSKCREDRPTLTFTCDREVQWLKLALFKGGGTVLNNIQVLNYCMVHIVVVTKLSDRF